MAELLGWHFVREDRRLGYGDGREVKMGETLTVEGPLEMCQHGLHASVRALDALQYAPGPIACRVRLSGEVLGPTDEHSDKACATERTVIAMVDATDILRNFIRDTLIFRQPHMVSLFEKAGLPDQASALRALEMETVTWEKIQEVCNAARYATWMIAAWAAERDAAWAAAWAAARYTAWYAAWAAERDATWAAAWDAARDATWAAARDTVSDAASDAARDELNERLEGRLLDAMAVSA